MFDIFMTNFWKGFGFFVGTMGAAAVLLTLLLIIVVAFDFVKAKGWRKWGWVARRIAQAEAERWLRELPERCAMYNTATKRTCVLARGHHSGHKFSIDL